MRTRGGRAAPESWTTLVLEGGPQGDRLLRAHGGGGALLALEAVGMAAVAVRESEARQDKEDAGAGDDWALEAGVVSVKDEDVAQAEQDERLQELPQAEQVPWPDTAGASFATLEFRKRSALWVPKPPGSTWGSSAGRIRSGALPCPEEGPSSRASLASGPRR